MTGQGFRPPQIFHLKTPIPHLSSCHPRPTRHSKTSRVAGPRMFYSKQSMHITKRTTSQLKSISTQLCNLWGSQQLWEMRMFICFPYSCRNQHSVTFYSFHILFSSWSIWLPEYPALPSFLKDLQVCFYEKDRLRLNHLKFLIFNQFWLQIWLFHEVQPNKLDLKNAWMD